MSTQDRLVSAMNFNGLLSGVKVVFTNFAAGQPPPWTALTALPMA